MWTIVCRLSTSVKEASWPPKIACLLACWVKQSYLVKELSNKVEGRRSDIHTREGGLPYHSR